MAIIGGSHWCSPIPCDNCGGCTRHFEEIAKRPPPTKEELEESERRTKELCEIVSSNMKHIESIGKAVKALGERGMERKHQITAMGIGVSGKSGGDFIKSLAKASDEELQQAIGCWNEMDKGAI